MTKTSASSAFLALNDFAKKNSHATLLLHTAAGDYAAARCLLHNGLLTGLVLGAQAIEKFLKAFLLLHDPACNVKGVRHSLTKLLQEADALSPRLKLAGFAPLVEKFWKHYNTRYPDNANASTSMTSADLVELDAFVVFLNENLPCARNVLYRTGLYAEITFSLGYKSTVTPTEFWIKNGNQTLTPLLPRIEADHAIVIAELYPSAPAA